MASVLVTGADGFVGRALCAALFEGDRSFLPTVRWTECGGISGQAPCAVGEIGASTDWSKALSSVSAVVHLASRVHVINEMLGDSLSAYREVNTQGTLNLARQAIAEGVRRFVFASTVKVNVNGGRRGCGLFRAG